MAATVASAIVTDASGQVIINRRPVPARAVIAGQKGRPANSAVADDAAENPFLHPDRDTLKKLSESRKLLAEGRFGEAVRDLDAILEGPEDFFIEPDKDSAKYSAPKAEAAIDAPETSPAQSVKHPDKSDGLNAKSIQNGPENLSVESSEHSGKFRGLKAEAQRLIGQMPREGRELYELQYGARARQMLNEALESGDATRLSEVSRRFFHTRSGYEATFLLGLCHFDHGRALAGALTLQRLSESGQSMEEFEPALSLTMAACWLQADMPDKACETLIALRQRHPTLRVPVAGREVPIFTDNAEAIDWLAKLIGTQSAAAPVDADRWLMFRGDASRNASTLGSAPLLNMRWRVPATDDPLAEKSLEQCQKTYAECGGPTIPALHPLAVGDVLLMRTLRNLLAVDIATGKRLWEVPVDDPTEQAVGGDAAQMQQIQMRQAMMTYGSQRIWTDMTYGTLSSDGRYVFSVEDLGLDSRTVASARGGGVVFGGAGGFLAAFNRFNGMNNGEQSSPCNELAAHEIRTGKLKWQIGGAAGPHALRLAETFFLGPPLPLQSQLYTLAEIKGEIRLLALDAATGDLLWSQQLASAESDLQDPSRRWAGSSPSYADGILVCPTSAGAVVGVELATRSLLWGYCFNQEGDNGRRNAGMFSVMMSRGGEPSATHWFDDSVSICDGRVLTTPADSDWLYCLSLLNGELLWKCRRKDDLYVACADRDKVVLVGRHAVRAVRLADGKQSWEGRTVGLPDNSSPSGRGFVSGNKYFLPLSSAEVVGIELAAGKIVQTSKSRKGTIPGNLVCFKGNIISQGLESVDAYYQLDAVSADVRRRLAANPNDAEALSLQGEILLDGGKRSEAIASFRRAHELDSDLRTRELLRDAILDGLRTEFVTYRGQAPQIEKLLDDSSQRAAYLRAMAAGLRHTGELTAAFDCYQKLADIDPDKPPLDEIDKTLVVRRDRWIRSQLADLRREATGDTAAKIDQAVAARFQSALAASSIEPLQRFCDGFGKQPAAERAREELIRRLNAAGRRLEAELAAAPDTQESVSKPDAAVRSASKHDADWPLGKIDVSTAPTKNLTRNGYGRGTLNLRGSRAPFFRDVSFEFDYNRRAIIAYDALGREQWQVSLAANGQPQYYSFNASLTHGCMNGHLLLLCLGWKVIAIDTLGLGPNGGPRVLWTQDLVGQTLDFVNGAFPPQLFNVNLQLQRQFLQIHDQSKLLGPVCRGYACFQRFHSLVAVDPRNGETLWSRQDVPFGCDLFGDDEYVFALPPDTDEATVFRAWDGELVGKRRIPRIGGQQVFQNGERKAVFGRFEETCLATLGRKLLLWWPKGNQRELTLVDPFEGRDLWKGRKFAANARACVVNDDLVGVMEPGGRLVLVSLPDGRTIADLKLEAEPSLMEITLFESGDQYFLLTRSSQGEANAPQFQPMPGCVYKPIHRGRLYAIDRQGKLQWPAPAVIKNQYLLASQPPGLPVITFACQICERTAGQFRYRASALCIDKRNGRTAFKKTFDTMTGLFDVSGNAAKKTVDLTMQQKTVTLTFTDKAVPPPVAATPRKASSAGKALRALWDSVQRMLGQSDDDSGRDDD